MRFKKKSSLRHGQNNFSHPITGINPTGIKAESYIIPIVEVVIFKHIAEYLNKAYCKRRTLIYN